MNNTQDKELKTAWIKAYSVVDQAQRSMLEDAGGDLGTLNHSACSMDINVVKPIMENFASYYKYSKISMPGNYDCGNLVGSMRQLYNLHWSLYPIKKPDGTIDTMTNWSGNGIALADGTFIFYTPTAGGASFGQLGNRVYIIFVDVNGAKKPNMWGKDFFQINFAQRGIWAEGINTATRQLAPCDSTNYSNCGAWILQDPNYKVPW